MNRNYSPLAGAMRIRSDKGTQKLVLEARAVVIISDVFSDGDISTGMKGLTSSKHIPKIKTCF